MDEIYNVWNESDIETVPEKCGKYLSSFPTDGDKRLSVSRNFYKKSKRTFRTTNGNLILFSTHGMK